MKGKFWGDGARQGQQRIYDAKLVYCVLPLTRNPFFGRLLDILFSILAFSSSSEVKIILDRKVNLKAQPNKNQQLIPRIWDLVRTY